MQSPDNSEDLYKLLATHRKTLSHLLRQQAMHTEAYVPPAITHGIDEARRNIQLLKTELRRAGLEIKDRPEDKPISSALKLSKPQASETQIGSSPIRPHSSLSIGTNDNTRHPMSYRVRLPSRMILAVVGCIITIVLLVVITTHWAQIRLLTINDPIELKHIGLSLLAQKDYDLALIAYQRAAHNQANDPEVQHGLGQAQLMLGKIDDARQAEQRALDLRAGQYPEALVGLGTIELRKGATNNSMDYFNAALQQNPHLVSAFIGLGRAAAANGNWSVASAYFQTAVSTDSLSAEAHFWYGEALLRINKTQEATTQFNQTISIDPEYTEAYFGLAQAQVANGQIALARKNIDLAIQHDSRYAEPWLLKGKLDEADGHDGEALKSYSQSISINKYLAEPYYRRAVLYFKVNNLDAALSDLQNAVKQQHNFPEAHYYLGRSYAGQGNWEQAATEFRIAVDQTAFNYPDALYQLSLAYIQLGRRDEAISHLQQLMYLDISDQLRQEAQKTLDYIQKK